MRGDKNKQYKAATVIDPEGNTQFYIIPGRLVYFGAVSITLMLFIAIVLSLLTLYNRYDLDTIKEQIKVEESKKDGSNNSQDPNR